MVVAGIFVGNKGTREAMSATTEDYVRKFWELIDEILNAVLFVLIGLELLLIPFKHYYFYIGIASIFYCNIQSLYIPLYSDYDFWI